MRPLNLLARVLLFCAGIYPLTLGIALNIKAGLGAGPWDVFHLGISQQLGISIGLAIPVVGLALVLLNLALGIRPNLGTLLNMLSIGPLVQLNLNILPAPPTTPAAWAMLAAGTLLCGVGAAAYTSADLGAGPRDGMMIGLTRSLGRPIAWIKNGIDISVCALGWAMGGPVGAGTLFVALTLGPAVQFGMYLMQRLVLVPGLSSVIRPPELKVEGRV